MRNKADLIINPIRMRIIQFASHNKPVTVAQIAQSIPEVSKATLYRHMRVLTDNKILTIVGEEKIRGTFEQSYALNIEKIDVDTKVLNLEDDVFENFKNDILAIVEKYSRKAKKGMPRIITIVSSPVGDNLQ